MQKTRMVELSPHKTEILNKPFEVKSICRQDLDHLLPPEILPYLKECDMEYIADKLGDYLQEDYWTCLEEVINTDYKKTLLKNIKKQINT